MEGSAGIAIVAAVGLVGGALSGLLGIGGGIVTAPLLLYLPGLFGLPAPTMHAVSGLTITQALFAGVFGALGNRGAGVVDRKLAWVMGSAVGLASLLGAAGSKLVPAKILLGIFVLLALAAAGLLIAPVHRDEHADYRHGSFSVAGAAGIAAAIGLLGGMVGQGGSFILIPLVLAVLRVPTRVAMGTNLVVVSAASLAGFVGKAATGQIAALPAAALVAGVLPGSMLGAAQSRRFETKTLRALLAAVIVAACLRMIWDLSR